MKPVVNFSYVFEVRENSRGPFRGRPIDGVQESLFGSAPQLAWTEYTPAPWKLYARITLTTIERRDGTAAALSFVIERGLMTILRRGDVLHLAALPFLGIAIVREGVLIAAAGAAATLTRIPLGRELTIAFPDPARVPIHVAPGARYRPEDFAARPVELSIAGERSQAWWRGRPTIGRYDALIDRGVHDGEPRISLELSKVCPETSAHTSAQLMDRDGYQIIEWQ